MAAKVIEQIIFEYRQYDGVSPYWGFTLWIDGENVGVGSADDIVTAMDMARELREDIEAGRMWKGAKQRVKTQEVKE